MLVAESRKIELTWLREPYQRIYHKDYELDTFLSYISILYSDEDWSMFDWMAFSFFRLRLILILDMRESTGFFPNFLVSLSFGNFYILYVVSTRESVDFYFFVSIELISRNQPTIDEVSYFSSQFYVK